MTTVKSLSREMKFFLLALIPIYFISVGLIIQPFDSIVTGIYEIIREPDFLITDYIAVGGMGAAFVNAGMMALISIYFVYSLGMEMDGHTITSCCLMFGFSLFGKNLMNIWAIFLGVFLYAKYHKMHLSNICVMASSSVRFRTIQGISAYPASSLAFWRRWPDTIS